MTTLTCNHDILTAEVKAHIEADALVRGEYWDGSKGCFIGCLTHSSDPNPAFERFGLPEPLLRIAESIFESLPDDEGRAFFAALPDAVGCDGKDLTRVHWAFLASELRMLPQKDVIDVVIDGMDLLVAGENWSNADNAAYAAEVYADAAHDAGANVYDTYAAYAAADAAARAADYAAAHAAAAARAAARAAAYAADYAAARAAARAADYAAAHADAAHADAAHAAACIRQRDSLLEIIKQAPMGE